MFGVRSDLLLYGVAAAAALLIVNRMLSGRLVSGAVETVAALPSDLVIGASAGMFGVPDTRTPAAKTACQQAKEAGDCWEASFQCPALGYLDCLRQKYFA